MMSANRIVSTGEAGLGLGSWPQGCSACTGTRLSLGNKHTLYETKVNRKHVQSGQILDKRYEEAKNHSPLLKSLKRK